MFTPKNIEEFGMLKTPFYAYDLSLLEKTIDTVVAHSSKFGFHVHYALKANSNVPVLERIAKKGIGADCVSGNEVIRATKTGFDPHAIVLAGVGKTDEEILTGIKHGIACFNVESADELAIGDSVLIRLHVALVP